MRIRCLILLAAGLLALPLLAESTYTYTGTPFNTFTATPPSTPNPYCISDCNEPSEPNEVIGTSVNGWFQVPGPLAPGLYPDPSIPTYLVPDAYSFSDGVQTLNNWNSTATLSITVEATGNSDIFDYWNLAITGFTDLGAGIIDIVGGSNAGTFGATPGDLGAFTFAADGSVVTGSTTTPGTWSEEDNTSPIVPEPSSFLLMITGMAGMLGFALRRI